MCKPAVLCCTVPMLHVGWNVDDGAWENLLRRLAFLLVPASSGNTYQHLSTTRCGVMNVPVVSAARFEGNIEERYLAVGYLRQIAVALEVFGEGCVWCANRKNHLTLECCLGVFAFYVFVPHLFCQVECSPSLWSTGIEGDVGDDFCSFCTGNAVVLCRLKMIFQRIVGDSLTDERSDCYQTAVAQ